MVMIIMQTIIVQTCMHCTCMQIKQELECYEGVTPHAVLACFLIRSGADIFLKNNAGITALQGLPIEVAAIAAAYAQQHQT